MLTTLQALAADKVEELAAAELSAEGPEPEATASEEAAPDPAAAPVETEKKEEVVLAPERWGRRYRLEHVKAHMMTECVRLEARIKKRN